MCRDLRKRSALSDVLKSGVTAVKNLLEDFEEQNDFMTVFDPPSVMRKIAFLLNMLKESDVSSI